MMETTEMHEEINRVIADSLTKRDEAALSYILDSPDGRWFLSRIIQNCHVYSSLGVLRQDGTSVMDTNAMLIQEGERRIGLVIRQNILAMPGGIEKLMIMEKEAEGVDRQLAELRKTVIDKYED